VGGWAHPVWTCRQPTISRRSMVSGLLRSRGRTARKRAAKYNPAHRTRTRGRRRPRAATFPRTRSPASTHRQTVRQFRNSGKHVTTDQMPGRASNQRLPSAHQEEESGNARDWPDSAPGQGTRAPARPEDTEPNAEGQCPDCEFNGVLGQFSRAGFGRTATANRMIRLQAACPRLAGRVSVTAPTREAYEQHLESLAARL